GLAERFEIPYHVFEITKENKAEQEARELALLAAHNVDFIVLARYMQILSDSFVRHYPNRIINIHHSFLPAFAGARPYHRAHDRGVKLIGATAHYVTADLDEGPIIEQDTLRVSHRDTIADLVRTGRDLEKLVLSRAVRLHVNKQIVVHGGRTLVFD
ncbi:MAG: formyltetrahydrofolate deformylase, partial [Rhodothermales bacterium]